MLTKSFKYTTFNGEEIIEEHSFNLNKAEIIEWLTTSGGYTLDKVLDRMTKERNGKAIIETFKDLIMRSYGMVSVDGRRFEKSPELTKNFMETEAYSQLFMDLLTDAKKAADFVNAIIPADLAAEVSKVMTEQSTTNVIEMQPNT